MNIPTKLLLRLLMATLLTWNGIALAQSANVADGISARLRADATRSSTAIALLPAGTPVEVLELKGDYARVSAAGKKGWVAQRLLRMKNTPKAVAASKASPSSVPGDGWEENQTRQNELDLVREEHTKNTWRMLTTTIGVAMAAFLSGFWLRGIIFRQRYNWLNINDRHRTVKEILP